jgi:hypothetical protein
MLLRYLFGLRVVRPSLPNTSRSRPNPFSSLQYRCLPRLCPSVFHHQTRVRIRTVLWHAFHLPATLISLSLSLSHTPTHPHTTHNYHTEPSLSSLIIAIALVAEGITLAVILGNVRSTPTSETGYTTYYIGGYVIMTVMSLGVLAGFSVLLMQLCLQRVNARPLRSIRPRPL